MRSFPLVDLRSLQPSDRLTAYIATAAGGFAFVAIVFTPIAILVSLGPGESLRRLRAHDAQRSAASSSSARSPF